MNPTDVVLKFVKAWEQYNVKEMNHYLADDFALVGAAKQPLDRQWFIADTRVRSIAFPDWKFNLVIIRVDGNVVQAVTEITATHLGTLTPPIPGIVPIPATGKQIRQPREPTHFTVRVDKIAQMWVDPAAKGGYFSILKQLGVNI